MLIVTHSELFFYPVFSYASRLHLCFPLMFCLFSPWYSAFSPAEILMSSHSFTFSDYPDWTSSFVVPQWHSVFKQLFLQTMLVSLYVSPVPFCIIFYMFSLFILLIKIFLLQLHHTRTLGYTASICIWIQWVIMLLNNLHCKYSCSFALEKHESKRFDCFWKTAKNLSDCVDLDFQVLLLNLHLYFNWFILIHEQSLV